MNTSRRVSLVAGKILPTSLLLLLASACWAQTLSSGRVDKTATLQLVPPEKLPRYGTFWSLERNAPLPFFAPYLREAEVPVYLLDRERNVFVVDDSAFDYDALYKQREEQRQLRRTEYEFGLLSSEEYWAEEGGAPGPMAYSYSPEDFWIEITGVTNDYAYLTMHGTVYSDTDWYQLLSKTNLAQTGEWTLRELLQGYPGTNQTVLQPVNMGDSTNMFFRGQHQNGYVFIQNWRHAYESNAVFAAANGSITVQSIFPSDVTVYYRVSGTASNGVDYSSLSGVLTISNSTHLGTIEVQPISDGIAEGTETVTITLVQTNGYLIASNAQSRTITINELSTVVQLQGDPNALSMIESNGPPGSPAVGTELLLYREDDRGLLPALTAPYSVTGTASNGVDFALLSGEATFLEGHEFAYININPLADNLVEGIESVIVTLLLTNTLAIDPGWASVTGHIADSSSTVTVFAKTNAIEPHPASNIPSEVGCFTVSRDDPRGELPALTVTYQMTGTATNGLDYVELSGTVTLLAGETDTNISIQPLFDGRLEGVETVVLTLSTNIDDYKLGPGFGSANLTIAETTTILTVSGATNALEPDSANAIPGRTGLFTIARSDSRGYLPALYVTYQMSGNATNNVDYTNLTGTVTIPPQSLRCDWS